MINLYKCHNFANHEIYHISQVKKILSEIEISHNASVSCKSSIITVRL